MKKNVDLIIEAGMILTIDENNTILVDHSLVINQHRIIDLISNRDVFKCYQPKQLLKALNKIVMPGLINTHSHIGMTYFKGLADDLPLQTWLYEYIWPAEAKYINPQFIYDASLHGIAELIKNGITTFNDMYFLPEETFKACNKMGIRAVLGNTILDSPLGSFHHPDRQWMFLEQRIALTEQFPLIDFALAPHSVYSCSIDSWKTAFEIAKQKNLLLHTHLAETTTEVENCRKQYSKTPLHFITDLQPEQTRIIFAHGIHLEKNDWELLHNMNCSISLNINSNLKLASGIAPIRDYIEHGINVTFGTDGVSSNNNLSIFNELSAAARLYKAIYNESTFLSAAELIKMATQNAANSLGKGDDLGSLTIGKLADIICLNTENFIVQPIYDPFSFLIYSSPQQVITDVIINGEVVLLEKKLINIDEEELLINVQKHMIRD